MIINVNEINTTEIGAIVYSPATKKQYRIADCINKSVKLVEISQEEYLKPEFLDGRIGG